MTVKRNYGDSCGIARALDAVGERWALLVVRELLLGPKRFTDLRSGLPRIGPDMLAARLRELEDLGLVVQRRLAPPAARTVYELTAYGRELEPVLHALGRWGSRRPLATDPPPLSPDAIVVAMQTMFESDPAARPSVIALRLDGHEFSLRADADQLVATAGAGAAPRRRPARERRGPGACGRGRGGRGPGGDGRDRPGDAGGRALARTERRTGDR